MRLLNDQKAWEIRENLGFVDLMMDQNARMMIMKRVAKTKEPLCRFTKWITIGSHTSIGFFTVYTHIGPGHYQARDGYIERSLREDIYNPYKGGVPIMLATWDAWSGSTGTNQLNSSFTAPTDFNDGNNFIDVIGGGGDGVGGTTGQYKAFGGGGGGGGYARRLNAPLTRGSTYYFQTGGTGGSSWFNITGSNAQPGSYAQGPYGGGGGNGSYNGSNGSNGGGGGSSYYGDSGSVGGAGGGAGQEFGGGGGGGGGYYGTGGAGGGGDFYQWLSAGGGGNGGGANVPTNADNATSGNGGNSYLGYGGGACKYASGAAGIATAGSNGGGGGAGGGYRQPTRSPYPTAGNNGGNGIEYNSTWGSGGGGGGGELNSYNGNGGGNGGFYGGGGGGGMPATSGQNPVCAGVSGLLIVYYIPAPPVLLAGPSFAGF